MFEYIAGTLVESTPHQIVVDVGGLGYRLFIPISTFETLPQEGHDVKLFVSCVIREDSHRLYGFLKKDERDLFETLNDISGIGPRLSISILGHMSLSDLHMAVEHENVKALAKIPGIGKKMAQRLSLELKDKFHKSGKEIISLSPQSHRGVVGDAISALINLGYPPMEAQKAVNAALPNEKELPLSELISIALKSSK